MRDAFATATAVEKWERNADKKRKGPKDSVKEKAAALKRIWALENADADDDGHGMAFGHDKEDERSA